MKLFDFYYDYDYGHDLYIVLGHFIRFNLLEFEIHTTRYWSWEPDINLSLGLFNGQFLKFRLDFWTFSFSFSLFSYRAPMDLSHTRELWK